jgi:hypothetical protein
MLKAKDLISPDYLNFIENLDTFEEDNSQWSLQINFKFKRLAKIMWKRGD